MVSDDQTGMSTRQFIGVVRLAAAAVVLLVLVASCGSDESSSSADLSPAARRGADVSEERGCEGCHSLDGANGTGPTWQGLAGSQVELTDGSTVVADAGYLTRSIEEPAAQTVQGFAPIMPTFGLSDDDVAALVAYIESVPAS